MLCDRKRRVNRQMTEKIKLIKIVDDFSFLIIKLDDQVDPRQIEDQETHVLMYETILNNEDNFRVSSELQYDEEEVCGYWKRILQ